LLTFSSLIDVEERGDIEGSLKVTAYDTIRYPL